MTDKCSDGNCEADSNIGVNSGGESEVKVLSAEKNTSTAEATICQPRYKSWALWVSILGLIGLILSSTGLLDKMGLTSGEWDAIISAVGGLLCAFGIVNNPTCSNKV